MSHVDSGFCVTDIESLYKVVKETCPDLELVKQSEFRTWVADTGSLVGDYPLPWTYQIKMLALVAKKVGVNTMREKAKAQGVDLPASLLDLEKQPLTLAQQNLLTRDINFQTAYQEVSQNVVGKDAEYVIRHKDKSAMPDSYEIGIVKHPANQGEYVMMADFYKQGKGLLHAKGVGLHKQVNGRDVWGGELKRNYAITAAEKKINEQIRAGNPEYGSYKKTVLADGRIKIEVTPRA